MNFNSIKNTKNARVKSFQIVPLRSFYIPMPLGARAHFLSFLRCGVGMIGLHLTHLLIGALFWLLLCSTAKIMVKIEGVCKK